MQPNPKDYSKLSPKAPPVPLCRGCVRPILDSSVLLLLPYSIQTGLSREPSPGEGRSWNKKPLANCWPRKENQKSRRPLRECQESLATTRWTPRDHPVPDFSGIDCYHLECLSCCECGGRLTPMDKRCWRLKDCQVICRSCRIRLTHCGRCRIRVNNDVWVHKLDRLPFHIACLTCSQCDRQLRPGDRCGLLEDRLFCLDHYLSASGSSQPTLCYRQQSAGDLDPDRFRASEQADAEAEGERDDEDEEEELEEREFSSIRPKDQFHGADNALELSGTRSADKGAVCEAGLKLTDSEFSSFPTTDSESVGCKSLQASTVYVPASSQPRTDSISMLMPSKVSSTLGGDSWYGPDQMDSNVDANPSSSTGANTTTTTTTATTSGTQLPTDCPLPVVETGHSVDSSTSSGCSAHSKSKRIRTSFTPDQLAILQANFDIEANPDGQELERIANVARLNKRVTQVWFQNARARKKKIECKGMSPAISMQLTNPSMYYLQEASNSEDESLIGLVDPNQMGIGEHPGCSLMPSYTATPLSMFKTPSSVPDGLAEIGTLAPYGGVNFSPIHPIESDLIHRRCFSGAAAAAAASAASAIPDPTSTTDRVYSILNSVKSMPTQCGPDLVERNGLAQTEKKVDSFHPIPWSTISGDSNRELITNDPALTNSAFLSKLPADGLAYGDFDMHRAFAFSTGRCLAEEIAQAESARRLPTADPTRSLAVFSR